MDLENETAFKDIDVSEPSLPVSIVDDDDSSNDGLNSSAHKNIRGKGVIWTLFSSRPSQSFETIAAVKQDAKRLNLSKVGASTYNAHKYACKIKGCSYLRKYEQVSFSQPYQIYFGGNHAHVRDETNVDDRSLSRTQETSIEKAFGQRMESARDIIELRIT